MSSAQERRPPVRSVSKLLWQSSFSANPPVATPTTTAPIPRVSTRRLSTTAAGPETPREYDDLNRGRRVSTSGLPPPRSSSQQRNSVPSAVDASASASRTASWVNSTAGLAATTATAPVTDVGHQHLVDRAQQLRAEAAPLDAAAAVVAGSQDTGSPRVGDQPRAKRRSSTSKRPTEPPPRPAACLPPGAQPWECMTQVRRAYVGRLGESIACAGRNPVGLAPERGIWG
jgi:hypothetical protein